MFDEISLEEYKKNQDIEKLARSMLDSSCVKNFLLENALKTSAISQDRYEELKKQFADEFDLIAEIDGLAKR